MNKFLYFTCTLLMTTTSFAGCMTGKPICPEDKNACPKETFMGDDGKCYDCYSDKTVSIRCMGHDEVFKRCPNRYTDISGCGPETSGLTCLNKTKKELDKLEKKSTSRSDGALALWVDNNNAIYFTTHTCQDDFGYIY